MAMWKGKWENKRVGFHLPTAHPMLVRFKTKLLGSGATVGSCKLLGG